MGYRVTVFESLPVAGGMMRVGIPAYRLPREVLEREIGMILAEGVELRLGVPVRDIDGLFAEGYSAVFLAIGAHEPQRLGIPGEDALGVYYGVPFLQAVSLGEEVELGSRVVVVGGGNTAVDAARTALRLGAKEVVMVYRRSREEMPANSWEVEEALREGVVLEFLVSPVAVEVRGGRVVGVRCQRMALGEPDESGRRRPYPVVGSEFVIEADAMIAAVAQAPEISFLSPDHGLEVTSRGTFAVDKRTLATNRPGVFVGGDAHRGPGILIEAIADGRRGALSIDRYLRGVPLLTPREEVPLPVVDLAEEEIRELVEGGEVEVGSRVVPRTVPVAERLRDFREVELSLTEEEARREAARCLRCGICSECHLCVRVCKAGAIDHQEAPREEELRVGAIILAPGFSLYPPELSPELGYGRFANVVTSLEFERMLSASGPFGGHVVRPSDGKPPKKVAFLQCVGSRSKDNDYCSSVCCMYATKEAIILKEHDKEVECTLFYMDMRCYGKDFEIYYERAKKDYGIRFIRTRVSRLYEKAKTKNLFLSFVDEDNKVKEEEFDLVVLSIGIVAPKNVQALADKLGISLNDKGFAQGKYFSPLETEKEGVFVCGAFTGPKDIPETVVEASAAAALSASLLYDVRGTKAKTKDYPQERNVENLEPRIGVFICHCGINIGGVVDVPAVKSYAATLPYVVYVEENLYTCSQDTQDKIKKAIEQYDLNRIVVASCSPRTHEPLFMETIREAGLNKYLFEMANIRDQCSWVHMHEPEDATVKAMELVKMTVAKAALLKPLSEPKIEIKKHALIIGGGLAGMESALSLSTQGFSCTIVEKESKLGGQLNNLYYTIDRKNIQDFLNELKEKIYSRPNIEILTETEIKKVEGYLGNFKTTLLKKGEELIREHGVIIVAVGAKESRPKEYLMGDDERVLTQSELEKTLFLSSEYIKKMKSIVMIQCVGSRIPENPNCSRICCLMAIKNAIKIKEISPNTEVYVLYRDIRTYGFYERYYTEARRLGVLFIPYRPEEKPHVFKRDTYLEVSLKDSFSHDDLSIKADLLVLSTAIAPEENEALAKILKVPLTADGYFLEAHMKLRPVDFATEGVFVAGMAHAPKNIPETIIQARAAAARAGATMAKGYITIQGTISEVDPLRCIGCGLCETLCPFNAIRIVETDKGKKSETIMASCKGCGICSSSCPQKAITIRHFTDEELCAQIEALRREAEEAMVKVA